MKKEDWIPPLAVCLLRVLFSTLRIEVTDESGILKKSPAFPLIFTFWHNRILAVAAAFLRVYPGDRRGVTVLTSPSRDGEILARVVMGLGMGSVRGSSSRRGATALRECLQIVGNGGDLAITPDGPRGPRYEPGPGVLLIAQQSNARIQPIHVRFGRALHLKTWDGFTIPAPFSKIHLTLAPYETIPETDSGEDFENQRVKLKNLLLSQT
jgi:lysophospholipid acyltransferase (LPLAT)-like uncharacterized protein